jgi:CCR4-NOT transcription complex subunit 9
MSICPEGTSCSDLTSSTCSQRPSCWALFLNAHIPLFLYPFLNTVSKTRPFEYLRLTSLGVIGALVKVDDTVGTWQMSLATS